MRQKSALPEFHHYRKLGRPDAHEIGSANRTMTKNLRSRFVSAFSDAGPGIGCKIMRSKRGRLKQKRAVIVKNPAVLHAPAGYLICDNSRSDSEAST
jgi:hypothetical protein